MKSGLQANLKQERNKSELNVKNPIERKEIARQERLIKSKNHEVQKLIYDID